MIDKTLSKILLCLPSLTICLILHVTTACPTFKKEHIIKSLPIMSPIQWTSHKYESTYGVLSVTYITKKDTYMNEKEKIPHVLYSRELITPEWKSDSSIQSTNTIWQTQTPSPPLAHEHHINLALARKHLRHNNDKKSISKYLNN